MGVFTCPDCSGTVSDRAAACPHCGAPVLTRTASVASRLGVAPFTRTMLTVDPTIDVCVTCHSLVKPERTAKGPVWVGWVLLPFYLLPGIIYFIWRAKSKRMVCPRCGGEALVPATSTRGAEIMSAANAAIPESTARLEICPSCMLPVSFPLGRNTIFCNHCTTKLTLTAPGRIETD